MSFELKVKAAALAAEAVIIRRLEKRRARAASRHATWLAKDTSRTPELYPNAAGTERQRLYEHRTKVVRPQARATHLARMFIKEVDYARVEDW